MQTDLDGLLVEYAAEGTQIELVGVDKVEGRDAYKFKLTLKNGNAIHMWIDAHTFLKAKMEGQPMRLDGIYHPVEIYYRNYQPVTSLQIAFVLETKVLIVPQTQPGRGDTPVPPEKAIIEKVVVNPNLDEALLRKPEIAAVPKPK
jgi:hypothetical protein